MRPDPKRKRRMMRRAWLKRTFRPRLYWCEEALCNTEEELAMANAYISDLLDEQKIKSSVAASVDPEEGT